MTEQVPEIQITDLTKCLYIDNDDHVIYIKALYKQNDIDGNDLYMFLKIDAYRTPECKIISSNEIFNIWSCKLNRYININDLKNIQW